MVGFNGKEYLLDHIGIAVRTIEEGAKFYRALGFEGMHVEVVDSEKVRVAMFELANQARIELLEPTVLDSPVGKFLDKRGPGIHHICFRVRDIRSVIEKLKSEGINMVRDEPSLGAHNCMVAFVHPQSAGGVLVELSEQMGQGDD